jgi:pimeloyl-ACP methyl ester carboxylesterase
VSNSDRRPGWCWTLYDYGSQRQGHDQYPRRLFTVPRSSEQLRVTHAELLGFSYGTYIGETFGTLFSERVGKVILMVS